MRSLTGSNLVVAFAAALLQAGGALGHGRVTSPTPRAYGNAALAACGNAVLTTLKSDLTGPIENSVKKIDSAYNATACHLYFCKGAQWEDNTSNTRVYKPGSSVEFLFDLVAHHTGTANVSIVDVTTQKTIGSPVFYWPVYANDSLGPPDWPANQTDFKITIPTTLGSQCTTKGKCAIQFWWWAYSNGQTYENCVDFTTV
ncbi:hypothetical protein GALMADRAFT_213393 [Galerina marginata CBS 339.88]|uniref:Chitin-binding type-4 domain-containing protein n=1 Tax=Galerina marginata (strain CBS 339.88) TaxID=685588 RepID=A0A067SXJ4_GALM3|nr:hypothetical protein GALMADRAFT_213393 [Galerina marginata CBS 339.88]